MRFVVDAQLPPLLADFLKAAGHEAEHVADLGLAPAPDSEIWRYAVERDAIIVTKDEDFAALRAMRRDGPSIVWMRVGNTTRDALLQIVRLTLPRVIDALERGEGVVEVTRGDGSMP